jgi:hypothetical protein
MRSSRPCAVLTPGLAALVLCLLPAAASAQSVTGRVLDSTTRRPLAHVTVTLVDSAGRPAARAETLPDGVFYLDAPAPGSYALDFAAAGAPAMRTPARPLAAGQEAQIEFVLAPPSAPPAVDPGAPSPAAVLLGEWYDPQPRGWPELELRIDRAVGDSVFGELTEKGSTTMSFVVRGKYMAPRVELRVARVGLPEARITGVLRDGYIVGQHIENRDWEHLLPAIRFGRQKY